MKAFVLLVTTACCAAAGGVDFGRDIRPILSEHCFTCHGPDAKARKAPFRLDAEAGLKTVVRPGDPGASELIRRVTASDARRMPPPWAGKAALNAHEVDLLTRWVAEGAR